MVTALTKPGRELAKRLLLIEFSVVMLVATGVSITVNPSWGLSALIGGGIFVIANAVFSLFAFLYAGARATKIVTFSFYTGEALKILLTIVLFSVAYVYMELELVPLKLTYLLVLLINMFAPVFFINKRK
ncbi:F0F1 ATP synthase subunit I [Vibrio inusitatus NBRC 102082]|uniref:F0F1 ATP synthase subunit I n=1 Tax=Vibrio inusitatus NBRC 102082 TaxID=1219070 RepID=A0A4Y3I296_9VIBR|nr:F0F1 ATP synthase subunit I [Vibrio inusitatus]GEA52574.1 F0F1 ATP synthase subunit I [Vibrio inusitatus NBRC 102082]